MLKFIPHKNNSHSWRTFLFVFFVLVVSACVAYFATANHDAQQSVAISSDTVRTENISTNETENKILDGQQVILPVLTSATSPVQEIEVEKPAVLELPKIERNKNPATRLEEARLYAEPKVLTGKYIDISLQYQNMVIFEDGKALDAYQISSGKKGMSTPTGNFKVENKSPKAWSKGYGLWMPNWMAFLPSGEMGIHELPIWPGGYQEGANHLGTPVSHGCVRLGVGAAKRVYDWAEIGTPIIIHQ